MAQHGQQAACETLLGVTRDMYKDYAADLEKKGVAKADGAEVQKRLISAAKPVSAETASFRSDQLIGTDVVSPRDQSLGSINDVVLNPQTGKIAYLFVRYGGFLGIDAKDVPVPWQDFKVTPGATLMVLDSTKNALPAGPHPKENQFSENGGEAELHQLRIRLTSCAKYLKDSRWRVSNSAPMMRFIGSKVSTPPF